MTVSDLYMLDLTEDWAPAGEPERLTSENDPASAPVGGRPAKNPARRDVDPEQRPGLIPARTLPQLAGRVVKDGELHLHIPPDARKA